MNYLKGKGDRIIATLSPRKLLLIWIILCDQ